MIQLIPLSLATLLAGKGAAALAGGLAGWLCWLGLRAKREQASPERQRERLRRQYWRRAGHEASCQGGEAKKVPQLKV